MAIADPITYLSTVVAALQQHWPNNRSVNVVFHGHSVPSGYFATPRVDTFAAYPHLLHRMLKERFPFAVINAICTAIGGEDAQSGAARFNDDVLCHRPDVLCIDYGLNDRRAGLDIARSAWSSMIAQAVAQDIPVILLTPSWDTTQLPDADAAEKQKLVDHCALIRELAFHYEVGLADSFAAFEMACQSQPLQNLLSWSNHPNEAGHQLIAERLAEWFPPFVR